MPRLWLMPSVIPPAFASATKGNVTKNSLLFCGSLRCLQYWSKACLNIFPNGNSTSGAVPQRRERSAKRFCVDGGCGVRRKVPFAVDSATVVSHIVETCKLSFKCLRSAFHPGIRCPMGGGHQSAVFTSGVLQRIH